MSQQQKTLAAKNPNQTHPKKTGPAEINTWHWLIKHPVEFSKNNHTPRPEPHQGPDLGATAPTYPANLATTRPKTQIHDRITRNNPHSHPTTTMRKSAAGPADRPMIA